MHFWDGERKVDMILAYGDEDEGEDGEKKAEKRKTFQRNLEEQGLELELEPSNVNTTDLSFYWILTWWNFSRDPQIEKPTFWKSMRHGTS